jgi:hypothetical protein
MKARITVFFVADPGYEYTDEDKEKKPEVLEQKFIRDLQIVAKAHGWKTEHTRIGGEDKPEYIWQGAELVRKRDE